MKTVRRRNTEPGQIQLNEDMVNRQTLAAVLGLSYDGNRNTYTSLGYPTTLKFTDYWKRYKRQDIASAVINRPIKYTWKGGIIVTKPEEESGAFAKAFDLIEKELKLVQKFRAVDTLSSIGEYAVLLLGFDDVENNVDFIKPVKGKNRKLLYIQPYSEQAARIVSYDKVPTSDRYDLPLTYEITSGTQDGASNTLQVHHSRIIHVAGEILTSEVKGTPVLEKVYNRLIDIEKLGGGSAEMFWRGARPGFAAEVRDDFTASDTLQQDLNQKVRDYENELTRILAVEGIDFKSLSTQVSSPKDHLEAQIDLISAATGIPKRILLGSERGELSSSQDSDTWADYIEDRRDEVAEPGIVVPFLDRCIEYGVLPQVEAYNIEWKSLHETSEKDKAETGKTKAQALQAYAANPMIQEIMPPQAFMKYMLGLDQDQIDDILAMIDVDAFGTLEPEEIEEVIEETIIENEE